MIPKRALADVLLSLGEAVFAEPHGIIVTDADGTLWSGDVGVDAFQALLRRGPLHEGTHAALKAEARSIGLTEARSPEEQAHALYEAELRGDYPGDRACAMMAWIFAGWSPAAVRAFAREVVTEASLTARLQPEALALLRWAGERSVPVVVVSASPLAVVEAAVGCLPGPQPQIIAMAPYEEGGVLLPKVRPPMPYGPGKAEALRARFGPVPILAALGDSGFDGEMLALARHPLAVRPKESLRRRAPEIVNLCELSP